MVRLCAAVSLLLLGACFTDQSGAATTSTTDDDDDGSTTEASASGSATSVGVTSTDPSTTTDATASATTSDATTSDATTSDATTGQSTGGPECVPGDACPYCVDGGCATCMELPDGCIGLDVADPVCNQATGLCQTCSEHDQCDSGACRIVTGECFPEDNRLWVDAGADCDLGTGAESAPFCTLWPAITAVDGQPGLEPWAVFVAGAASPYQTPDDPALPSRPFALIGPSSGLSAEIAGIPPLTLRIYDAAHDRYIARVSIRGGTEGNADALECVGGDVWIHDAQIHDGVIGLTVAPACQVHMFRSRITAATNWGADVSDTGRLTIDEGSVDNNAGAIRTDGITTLRRTTVANNYINGGIRATGGSVSLTNVAMHANGYDIGHIDLGPGTSASLNYVVALWNTAGGVSCGFPSSSYSIRNSIVDVITCPVGFVEIDQSLVGEGLEGLGDGNVVFPPGDYAQVFVNHPGGNLHIGATPPGYLLGIAMRSATDPADDLDGDPRPDIGEPDYPGPDAP